MQINFKKLDNNCYYVTDGNSAINIYVRYSSFNKHYEIDADKFYWECKTINEMKDKVTKYWIEGKFNSFEVN